MFSALGGQSKYRKTSMNPDMSLALHELKTENSLVLGLDDDAFWDYPNGFKRATCVEEVKEFYQQIKMHVEYEL